MPNVIKDNARLKYCAQFNLGPLLNTKDYPILKKRGVGPSVFKYASLGIIDCMKDPYYSFSYPSYQYLAETVLCGKTSVSDHIHLVENSGLFHVKRLSAKDCKSYLWRTYGQAISTTYPRGPAIYEINFNSPFWQTLKAKIDSGRKGARLTVPKKVVAAMLERAFGVPPTLPVYPRPQVVASSEQRNAILRVS